MLVKLVLAAILTVGVLGGIVPEEDRWMNSLVASDYCKKDKIQQVKVNLNENVWAVTLRKQLASFTTMKLCLTLAFTTDESFVNEVRQATFSNNQQADVIKAICARSSQMKTCIRPLITSLTPCFTASGLRATQKDMDTVLDFFCANNGAKMTLFLKEGGQECMEKKRLSFAACKDTKTTAITRLVGVYGSGPAIPEHERCKLDKQENTCTLTAMKTCTNPVPANIVEEALNKLEPNCNDNKQETQ